MSQREVQPPPAPGVFVRTPPEPFAGSVQAFLWRCAGRDPETMPTEHALRRAWYTAAGASVVGTGCLGALSAYALLAFPDPVLGTWGRWLCILGAGLLISQLQRLVVIGLAASVSAGGGVRRLGPTLLAAMIAATLTPLLGLAVARSEIDFWVREHAARLADEQGAAEAERLRLPADGLAAELATVEAAANAAAVRARASAEEADRAAGERNRPAGCGAACRELRRVAETEAARAAGLDSAVALRRSQLEASRDRLRAQMDGRFAADLATALTSSRLTRLRMLLAHAGLPLFLILLGTAAITAAPVLVPSRGDEIRRPPT